jgi:hypothetical protein
MSFGSPLARVVPRTLRILSPGNLQEELDVLDLLRL